MSRISTGASNLGKIAKEYSMHMRTLMALIAPYPELVNEIEMHTKDSMRKGQKTLPPKVVNKIYETLGEP